MKNRIFELYKPRSLEEFKTFYRENPDENFVYVYVSPVATIEGSIGAPPSFFDLFTKGVAEKAEEISKKLETVTDNVLDETVEASENFGTVFSAAKITLYLAGIAAAGALFVKLGGGKIFGDAFKAYKSKGKK